jgi:LuxR family maltose regulon positive regulatory protein
MSEPDLLVTKYIAPRPRSTLLHRDRLLVALDQSRAFPLTLLSASAGFGKTTLLADWAGQRAMQVAWLSLDDQDNDPTRFWAYVIAALRHGGSPVGMTASAMLHAPGPSSLTGALTSLINELAALSQDVALILDDYHLVGEPTIHESLQFLLDHLPYRLHLILSCRGDPPLPLARLRARGQVLEIRAADLRLSGEDAKRFLTQIMGLALTEEEIGRLDARTEGWIAGLQLAALSLRRHQDVSAFVEAFAGSHRFILDYVQEEILGPLPDAERSFLLRTAVLNRMNAEICQVLTGEPASQLMLESFERANLFLVPLDEERSWYRFHALFREVLLARLQATQPEQVAVLHREAALWYWQHDQPHDAIFHALAAKDFPLVASFLEEVVERLYQKGELKTLLTWIKQLPDHVVHAHPRLATTYILAFQMLFPFSDQKEDEYLQQLRDGVEEMLQSGHQTSLTLAERDRLRHRLTILDSWSLVAHALSDGDADQLHRLAEQGQQLPLDDESMWQQYQLAPFSIAWRMAGNFPPMVAALQESRARAQQTRNRYHESQIIWGLIAALIASGQLRQAHGRCQELKELVDSLGGPLPVAAYPDLFQAQLAYQWNHLEAAKSAALQAIEKTRPLQYMDILMGAFEVLVRVGLAQGDLAGAEQAVRDMESVYHSAGVPLFHPWIESLRVQLWLAQGNLIQATDWAEHSSYRQEKLVYPREGAYLALVRVDLAQQQYTRAFPLLGALLNGAEQVSRIGSVISILALDVTALQVSGATDESLRVLARLLRLAAPEGYVRVFLDEGEPMLQALRALLTAKNQAGTSVAPVEPSLMSYAQTLIGAFASEPRLEAAQQRPTVASVARPATSLTHPPARALLEPLTPRELEVLHLLGEGTSNQEIARQLVVSLATAKKHVASILGKLGAENRTQAIARARSLSLL